MLGQRETHGENSELYDSRIDILGNRHTHTEDIHIYERQTDRDKEKERGGEKTSNVSLPLAPYGNSRLSQLFKGSGGLTLRFTITVSLWLFDWPEGVLG